MPCIAAVATTKPEEPVARRALLVVGLLLAEFLLLSFAFDVQPATAKVSGLSVLGWFGPWALCCGAGTVWRIPTADWRGLQGGHARPTWPWFVHGVAYFALAAAAAFFVREPSLSLALGLMVLGAGVGATAIGAAFPLAGVLSLLRRRWHRVLAGILIGSLAFGAGWGASYLWDELADLTLLMSALLLELLVDGIAINPDTRLLGLEHFRVIIAPVCSGIEGLGLTAVLVSFYIFHFRRELGPRGWWALPLALLASYTANIVRIVALILIGEYVSPTVAIGGFHSKAGWVLFIAVALGTVAILRRRAMKQEIRAPAPNPVTPYLAPLMIVVGASMLTGLFVFAFPRAYPLTALLGAAAIWTWAPRTALFESAPRWLVPSLAGVLAYVLWIVTLPVADQEAVGRGLEVFKAWPLWAQAGWIFFRFVGGVGVAPVVEELAFRGFLLRRLRGADFEKEAPPPPWSAAAILSSLAFGFAHSTPVAGTLAGLVYAWVYARRGSLGDAVVAHAVSNLIIAVQVVVLGDWWLWL